MKKIIIALAATTALTTGAFAQDATTTTDATAKELNIGGVRIGNPFDKSTWWSIKEAEDEKIVVNFTDPEFYINFFNPKTHAGIHAGITNPADWAQLMKVETYANMLDYTKWSKWIEGDTYAPLLDLQNYAYWMQPGAYAHDFDISHYAKMFDVNAYGAIVDATFSNFGYSFKTPSDLLSYNDWANSVTAAGTVKTDG